MIPLDYCSSTCIAVELKCVLPIEKTISMLSEVYISVSRIKGSPFSQPDWTQQARQVTPFDHRSVWEHAERMD